MVYVPTSFLALPRDTVSQHGIEYKALGDTLARHITHTTNTYTTTNLLEPSTKQPRSNQQKLSGQPLPLRGGSRWPPTKPPWLGVYFAENRRCDAGNRTRGGSTLGPKGSSDTETAPVTLVYHAEPNATTA